MYEFRKLNSTDIFKMIRVIKKLNIKELGSCFDSNSIKKVIDESESTKEEIELSVGIEVAFKIADVLFDSMDECENELYDLLSNCSNLNVDQIKRLDLDIFLKMIVDFLQKEELKDFIMVVLKLMKSEK